MDKSLISFILLIVISITNPELIYNLNKSFIGNIIILICIVFFSMYNIVLGLLMVFIYFAILEKYRYIIEGMTEQKINTPNTIGEIEKPKTKSKPTKNEEHKIIISTSTNSNGIDIQDIQDAVSSKDSNSFPLSKNMFVSSDAVEPFNMK
jgi:hypothetical protein